MNPKNFLLKQFSKPLLGFPAQSEMSPIPSFDDFIRRNIPINHKTAAVFALLYYKNSTFNLIYIKRALYEGVHSAQIAFPGGQLEKNETALEAAYRETFEEIGIKKSDINFIAPLSEIYVPASNFLIKPFVGFIEEQKGYNIDKKEIENVIEISIEHLNNKHNVKIKPMNLYMNKTFEVKYYEIENEILWGATAMITAELLAMLNLN